MKYLLFLLFLIISAGASAQNGKIVTQARYEIPETVISELAKQDPGIRAALGSVECSRITYLSDGLKVQGFLWQPKKAGRYPCVIYNRGGNLETGKVTDIQLISRGLADLCRSGYVVVASQYRGNDGGEGREEFGGKDMNDVLNLIPLLGGLPKADTSRIGMFGWSRGGMMTYLALTKTKRLKAAVVGSGASDLEMVAQTRPDMEDVYKALIPGYAPGKTELLKQCSANYFAEQMHRKTPTLILHGTADWRVPCTQTLELAGKLHGLRFPFRMILYEGGEHALDEHRADFIRQIQQWFDTYLRDGKAWPSLEPHGK